MTGAGSPVPPPDAPDGGSTLILAFDLERCRYNVHVQALVAGTYRSGDESGDAQAWATSFQSGWRPIPAGMILSDEAAYPALSEDFILAAQELADWYAIFSFDLVDLLGEGALGTAPLAWHLTPN